LEGPVILFYIGVGAAAGAIARYGLGGWIHAWAGSAFPWGTFTINAAGSLLIGFAVGWLEAVPATPETRALVTMGLLGGFTTFSTYTYETIALLRDGEWLRAGLYSLGSLGVGLLAVVAGLAAAGALLQARG
jgi:CrcB protein